jgi:catechol 2,3-dioxygenase
MSQPPKYLGHFTILVRDAARAKAWYTGLLRLHTDSDAPGPAAFLSCGPEAGADIALIEVGADAARCLAGLVGRGHTVWRFDSLDDLAGLYCRAVSGNIAIEHVARYGHRLSIFLRDPDGNDVEAFYEVPQTAWPRAEWDFDDQFYGPDFLAPCVLPGPWDELAAGDGLVAKEQPMPGFI